MKFEQINLSQIHLFNELAGHKLAVNEGGMHTYFRLIEEELGEMKEAHDDLMQAIEKQESDETIEEKKKALAEEIADVIYVVTGLGHTSGVNIQNAFENVTVRNFEKFIPLEEVTEKDLTDSIKDTEQHYGCTVKINRVGNLASLLNKETGKLLKPKHYREKY